MTGLEQNQNLINPIRIEKIEPLGKPRGFYKSMVLDILGVLAAFFVGYAYFEFLYRVWPLSAPLGAFLLLAVILTLEALVGEGLLRRIGIVLCEVVAFLLPFYAFDARILAAAGVLAFIFFLAGYVQCRRELDHSTTIRFFRSTHGVVAKAVTAALFVAIILYTPMATGGMVFLSESAFNGVFTWAAGLANNFYPTLSLTGSFDDFARSVARGGLTSNAAFEALPPAEQDAAVAAAASQVESNLAKSFDMTVSSTTPTSDVVYNIITYTLQGWRAHFAVWFTVGWEITLFLVLRCIGIFAIWIGQFVTMIVYELLLAAGFIHIAEESQTKEVITF